jgi:hypothetical protein
VIPWLIIAVIAVPSLVVVFAAGRKATASGQESLDQSETGREFAAAEAYEERWREEEHRAHRPESLY